MGNSQELSILRWSRCFCAVESSLPSPAFRCALKFRLSVCTSYLYALNHTGKACRKRVLTKLNKEFSLPADAEKHYFSNPVVPAQVNSPVHEFDFPQDGEGELSAVAVTEGCITDPLSACFSAISKRPNWNSVSIVLKASSYDNDHASECKLHKHHAYWLSF